ncbi:Flagellar motor rotation protein MotB [plant metagenome]|uniref:Flagellar motor rotation protein MotB n=1 Tax=plant metagenome TaxID=1297885 RepID=A0A484R979_9ZZZZ
MSPPALTLADLVERHKAAHAAQQRDTRKRRRARDRQSRWHIPDSPDNDTEGWQLIYQDLITLLLALVLALFALSRVDALKTTSTPAPVAAVALVGSLTPDDGKENATGIRGALAAHAAWTPAALDPALLPVLPVLAETATAPQSPQDVAHADMPAPETSDAVHAGTASTEPPGPVTASVPALRAPSAEELGLGDLGNAIDVVINEQSVSFRISNELLFGSGQATLSASGPDLIRKLAEVVKRNDYPLSVEGHSDNVPIQTRQFPSNWELSSSRATSVLRELVRDGVPPARLRAVGFADTRPLSPNDTTAGRAANRRVELVMEITPPNRPAEAAPSAAPASPEGSQPAAAATPPAIH